MICENCKNIQICKHVTEAREKTDKVNALGAESIVSPLKIKLECSMFEKRPQKQDGIFGQTYRKEHRDPPDGGFYG